MDRGLQEGLAALREQFEAEKRRTDEAEPLASAKVELELEVRLRGELEREKQHKRMWRMNSIVGT